MKKIFKKIKYKLIQFRDLLFYTQIRYTLPRSEWEGITIQECGEKLIYPDDYIILNVVQKSYQPDYRIRQSISKKLTKVALSLPKGLNLVLIEGYRSFEHQKSGWDRRYAQIKKENPNWNDEQIESTVRQVVAKPSKNANHITGAAVDVTLCDSLGNLLDMGSLYPSALNSMQYRDKFPMFAKGLTVEQEKNRKILRDAMTRAGFVYYPGEWWHYCYGDRMWAVYTKRDVCMYGAVE